MIYSYNKQYSPPAPVLTLKITLPELSQSHTEINGQLDTGADISAIPAKVVEELDLEPASEILISGYNSQEETIPTYIVGLELPQARVRHIEVITIPEYYVLLGRDILNHFYINLNGPDLTFEMAVQHNDIS